MVSPRSLNKLGAWSVPTTTTTKYYVISHRTIDIISSSQEPGLLWVSYWYFTLHWLSLTDQWQCKARWQLLALAVSHNNINDQKWNEIQNFLVTAPNNHHTTPSPLLCPCIPLRLSISSRISSILAASDNSIFAPASSLTDWAYSAKSYVYIWLVSGPRRAKR